MMSVGFIFRLSCQAARCNRNAPVVGEWFTDLFLLTLKLRKLKMRTEITPEGNVLISRKLVDQESFKVGVRRHLGWFHKGVFRTKWKGNNFPCCMMAIYVWKEEEKGIFLPLREMKNAQLFVEGRKRKRWEGAFGWRGQRWCLRKLLNRGHVLTKMGFWEKRQN